MTPDVVLLTILCLLVAAIVARVWWPDEAPPAPRRVSALDTSGPEPAVGAGPLEADALMSEPVVEDVVPAPPEPKQTRARECVQHCPTPFLLLLQNQEGQIVCELTRHRPERPTTWTHAGKTYTLRGLRHLDGAGVYVEG